MPQVISVIQPDVNSRTLYIRNPLLGRVAQSVTCLVTDASLTADPGVANSIPVRSHTFMEIAYEIISTVILLTSAEEGLLSVTSESMCTKYWLTCPGKKVWLELTVPP